jgi:hypothetical protein
MVKGAPVTSSKVDVTSLSVEELSDILDTMDVEVRLSSLHIILIKRT